MAEGLVWLVCFIVGHVFGSIPCGLWLVKAAHGIDIREYGSKNIGTTNVFRTVGGKTAFCTLMRYDEGDSCCSVSGLFYQ